jgi:hypothetical protein
VRTRWGGVLHTAPPVASALSDDYAFAGTRFGFAR